MRRIFKRGVAYVLRLEARAVLRKYNPKIVAITGSVGKTSTKDAIFAVLSKRFHVRKSEKSFNSEIGLPLTILGLANAWGNPFRWVLNIFDGLLLAMFQAQYPEWLVLEVGADRPGDIRALKSWLPIDVVVITRLPEVPVHVEFFNSAEELMEEKASLIDALKPGGVLVLYGDDERTKQLERRWPQAQIVQFGFSDVADVRGENFMLVREETGKSSGFPIGMSARIAVRNVSAPITIMGSLGPHAFLPAIAAAAVGEALGVSLEEIVAGLAAYEPPPGRMRLLPGIKDSLIIDDTYNASPAATISALDTLETAALVRRVAVLGDMLELGRVSVEEHRKIGARAAQTCNLLVTVGFRARDIAQGALDAGLRDEQILQYESSQKAGQDIQNLIREGDCILVKGSQSIRMECVVEEIMAEPERAAELLVRQDAEWKKR